MPKAIPSTRTSYARGLARGIEILESLSGDAERGYFDGIGKAERALYITKKALELSKELSNALRGKSRYGGVLGDES